MKIEPEEYCGYKIWPEVKTIEKSNPLSGYNWTENKRLSTFYVVGPGARVNDVYKNTKKAKEHIDFLIRFKK